MLSNINFATCIGCKRDDRIPSQLNIEGRYVNSQRVYISGKLAGLIIVSQKYDSSLLRGYYYQSFAFDKGEWKSLPLSNNSLAAAQAAFY